MKYILIVATFYISLFAYYPKYPVKVFLDPSIDYYKGKVLINGYLFENNRFCFKEHPFNDNKSYFLDERRVVYSDVNSLCIYDLKNKSRECKELGNYVDALSVSKDRDYYAVGFGSKVLLYFKNKLYKTFNVKSGIREISIKNGKIFITYTARKNENWLNGYINIYSLDGNLIFNNKIGKFALYPIVTDGEYLYHTDGNNVYITDIKQKRVERGILSDNYMFQDANEKFIVASTKKKIYVLKRDYRGNEILHSPSNLLLPINLKAVKTARSGREIKSLKILGNRLLIFYKMGAFEIVDFNLKTILAYKPKDTKFVGSVFLTKDNTLIIGYNSKIFRISKNFEYSILDTNCSISADVFYADKSRVLYTCYEKYGIRSSDSNLTLPLDFEPTKAVLKDGFYYIGGKDLFKFNILKLDSNFTEIKRFGYYPKKKGYIHDFFFEKDKKRLIETNWDKSYLEDEKEVIYAFKEQGEAKRFENGYIVYDSVEKKISILDKNLTRKAFIKTEYKISEISANNKGVLVYQEFDPYRYLTLYRLDGTKVYDMFLFSDNSFLAAYPDGKIFTTKKENLKYIIKP